MTHRNGLALIVVVGILGVLAVLAVAFVAMAQLERRASEQRVNAARAYLLARSGVEDALARLELGQDPAYGGENWDGSSDGLLSAFEAKQEIHRRTGAGTPADVADCPVKHAMRPSFFAALSKGSSDPALVAVDGRERGYSGTLAGDHAPQGNAYALKVSSSNAGIYINGGALDDKDRDPDGPGAKPEDFPLNPGAAAEVAPLLPNHVLDFHDASMEGPNGFLVRLLNNLDSVVTNGATSNLGVQVIGARPVGGYQSLDELKPILGQARHEQFKPYLTLQAWVDGKVVKPQPMDGRPHRWEDIDDAHRIGAEAQEISGVHVDPAVDSYSRKFFDYKMGQFRTVAWSGPRQTLNPGISGNGKEPDPAGENAPWTQTITALNWYEGAKSYPVTWERNFVYAASQLRPGPAALEPRAPLSLNAASPEALASVFLGLKGTTLETWDGSAGWEGGFGWYSGEFWMDPGYLYPAQNAEESPWIRTRVDYGMTYGAATGSPPARPWYGPRTYDPHAAPRSYGGKPVVQAAPLGRLKETDPITLAQALAGALEARQAIQDLGPARTWAKVNAFVDALPRWEDVDEDGLLDGAPYAVKGSGSERFHYLTSGGTYTRRVYMREDADSDAILQRETFTPLPGTSWKAGSIAWLDPHLPKAALGSFDLVPGLTFLQKDVLKAMLNPNTDLNDFNPDGNLWKEVDKTDLAGIQGGPGSHVYTTELSLDDSTGYARIQAVGRVTTGGGRLLALRQAGALVRPGEIYRDTTQADFMRAYNPGGQSIAGLFSGAPAPYPLSGNQALVSYPEPQTVGEGMGSQPAANAAYDGQIALGFIGAGVLSAGGVETLRGDLFDTRDAQATADPAFPDLKGPWHAPLVGPAPVTTGNVFPDGVYSEKDRALKYLIQDNIPVVEGTTFYLACWAKPNWFPEASPRAHALVSMSGLGNEAFVPFHVENYGVVPGYVPLDDILAAPVGLTFVPARNNLWQDKMGTYIHDPTSTRGGAWPRRSLLWGTTHSLYASDCLNRRGIYTPPGASDALLTVGEGTPSPQLDGHRWKHVAMTATIQSTQYVPVSSALGSKLVLGRMPGSFNGGGWNLLFGAAGWQPVGATHVAENIQNPDPSPNHLRFGEIAGEHNMNYTADATFANVRVGMGVIPLAVEALFASPLGPAALGRYYKETATYTSAKLPSGIRPLKATWTEIPCRSSFQDNTSQINLSGEAQNPLYGWFRVNIASVTLPGVAPAPGGPRDVHIALEIWADMNTPDPSDDVRLARFDDPAGENRIPAGATATGTLSPVGDMLPAVQGLGLPPGQFTRTSTGRLYYKALFVNEWDADTRANYPLDVTPFLDDVTIQYAEVGGPRVIAYDPDGRE